MHVVQLYSLSAICQKDTRHIVSLLIGARFLIGIFLASIMRKRNVLFYFATKTQLDVLYINIYFIQLSFFLLKHVFNNY